MADAAARLQGAVEDLSARLHKDSTTKGRAVDVLGAIGWIAVFTNHVDQLARHWI